MRGIHQFVGTLQPGAVGNHTLQIQQTLQQAGYESDIYAEFMRDGYEGRAIPYQQYAKRAQRDDITIYQFAIGSEVANFVRNRNETLIVDYHNITPAEFFERWEPGIVPALHWGRKQLAELASRCELGVADSSFNAHELEDLGYRKTGVVPILLDIDDLDVSPDSVVMGKLKSVKATQGGADLIFVGRISPNKCQHDLVKVLVAYRAAFDPNARLHLVGASSADRYVEAIQEFAEAAGVSEAVNITGSVTPAELSAYYRSADIFVSASEHEGFCVPLLESMHYELPIVAYSAAAVPETLGDAGVLLESKAPELMAAAVHRVLTDQNVRTSLIKTGHERLALYSLAHAQEKLLDAVQQITGVLA